MHLQDGTLRRKGTEQTRIPHFLIVDEYSRYINPEVETFLSLAAEYRVAGILATQSLGQLAIESGKLSGQEMKRTIMASCRNRIVFGGVTMDDAKDFAEEFGKDKVIVRQSTYDNKIVGLNLFPKMFRDTETEEYRFDPTDIRNGLSRFTYIHQLMKDGVLQEPAIGQGTFVPHNWRELREWEENSPASDWFKKINPFKSKKDMSRNVKDLSKKNINVLEDEAEQENQLLVNAEQKKEQELEENKEKFNEVVDLSQLESNTENVVNETEQLNSKQASDATKERSEDKPTENVATTNKEKSQNVDSQAKKSERQHDKTLKQNESSKFTKDKKNDDMFF